MGRLGGLCGYRRGCKRRPSSGCAGVWVGRIADRGCVEGAGRYN